MGGIVLVDPMPVGFQGFYDDLLPDLAGHPPWLDLDAEVSASLDGFGDVPLTVIEQDLNAVFLSPGFVQGVGREAASPWTLIGRTASPSMRGCRLFHRWSPTELGSTWWSGISPIW